jgi:hypothetical protein
MNVAPEETYRIAVAAALKTIGASESNIAKGELFVIKHLVNKLEPLVNLHESGTVDKVITILRDFAKGADGVVGTADDLLTAEQLEFFRNVISNDKLLKQLVTYFVHKRLSSRWVWLKSKFTCLQVL